MFIRRALALVVAILWLSPASLHAQSEALMDAFRQGEALYDAGRYEDAIPNWQRAIELGERELGPDHPTTGTLLVWLAYTFEAQGRYAEAEPLYKRVLAINEKVFGPEHRNVASR